MWKFCAILFLTVVSAQFQLNPKCKLGAPKDVDADKCCVFPTLIDEIVQTKCKKEHGAEGSKDDEKLFENACLAECVFKESKLDANSTTFKDDVIKQFDINSAGDKSFAHLIPETINNCLHEATPENLEYIVQELSSLNKKKKRQIGKTGCDPLSVFMLNCIYIELFVLCPSTKWTSNEQCDLYKQYSYHCEDW